VTPKIGKRTKLPRCVITEVFWSEAQNELIEYLGDSPVVQHAATGHVSRFLKSYSAPVPSILGKYHLKITTVVPKQGGERLSFSFSDANITDISSSAKPGEKPVWTTRFETYTPPERKVATTPSIGKWPNRRSYQIGNWRVENGRGNIRLVCGRYGSGITIYLRKKDRTLDISGYYDHMVGIEGATISVDDLLKLFEPTRRSG
jgi:hypothetical protein